MTFAPAEKRYQSSEGSSSTFKRINWMKLPIGIHTVRILEEPATKFYTHWIKVYIYKKEGKRENI